MKVVFPKNIQKWMLAGISFQIGPVNLSIIQLFVVGIGVAAAMAVFNWLSKSWGKAIWAIFAIITLLIFVFIGFFKMSELSLIPFVAKLVRNNFFDVKKKFQTNYDKQDPIKLAIKKIKADDDKEQTIFEHKDKHYSKDKIDDMNKGGLLG